MDPRPHLLFCACKTTRLASELLDSMGPTSHLWFLHQNSEFMIKITSLYGSQTSPVSLCMQNRVISTRNTSPLGSQTSLVHLCMENNVISTRIASLYGSHPSSVVFSCKTADFGSELQVSMGPRPHLSFCAC